MRKRTQSREFALQILYQVDMTKDPHQEAILEFWSFRIEENIDDEIKNFSDELVKGVCGNLKDIDANISSFATNWQLKRMAVVDRNVLRLGVFELIFRPDIPPKVTINEAVELAKKYSGPEAGKFVNGILDKIKKEKNL